MNKKTITATDLRKYFGSETLEASHTVAVVDGDTVYALGASEEEAILEFRDACRDAGIELGDYEVVDIVLDEVK